MIEADKQRQSVEAAKAEQKRLATLEAARIQQEAETAKAAQEQASGDACDRAAANPTDARKPSEVDGVEYNDLKRTARSAQVICAGAIRSFPTEQRYKYNWARATEFIDAKQAAEAYKSLTQSRYAAAYDNYGGILLGDNRLQDAIRQYDAGVKAGDPSAMASVAWLIKQNRYTVANPAKVRLDLLTSAAKAGHRGAQATLEGERVEQEAQAAQKQRELQMQQNMFNIIGGVMRGVAR